MTREARDLMDERVANLRPSPNAFERTRSKIRRREVGRRLTSMILVFAVLTGTLVYALIVSSGNETGGGQTTQGAEPNAGEELAGMPSGDERPDAAAVEGTTEDPTDPASGRWSRMFGGGDEGGQYRSLPEMVQHTPEIVRGAVGDVEPGRVVGDPKDGPEYMFQEVYFVLRAKEVLAGDAFSANDEIRMGIGGAPLGTDIRSRYSEVVGDEGLFFLIRLGAPQPEFDRSGDLRALPLDAYRPVNGQGVYVNDQGQVTAARRADPGFQRQLHGMPFEELVELVEELVAER